MVPSRMDPLLFRLPWLRTRRDGTGQGEGRPLHNLCRFFSFLPSCPTPLQDTEDLDHYEMKEEEPAEGKKSEDDGIGKENLAILEKIKKNQRQDYLNVRAFPGRGGWGAAGSAPAPCGPCGRVSSTCSPVQGAVSGSVQATDRLMKELRDIYRSQSFKGGECASQGPREVLGYAGATGAFRPTNLAPPVHGSGHVRVRLGWTWSLGPPFCRPGRGCVQPF